MKVRACLWCLRGVSRENTAWQGSLTSSTSWGKFTGIVWCSMPEEHQSPRSSFHLQAERTDHKFSCRALQPKYTSAHYQGNGCIAPAVQFDEAAADYDIQHFDRKR